MHDDIKKFSIDGEIGDANVVEAKDRLIAYLEGTMRDDGFVPALDLEPQFTRTYKADREVYHFVLTIYGIQVGKAEAWKTGGILNGKTIPKSIPPVRLKQS